MARAIAKAKMTRGRNEIRAFPGLKFETGGTQGSRNVEFAIAEFIFALGTSTALHTVLSLKDGTCLLRFVVYHPFAKSFQNAGSSTPLRSAQNGWARRIEGLPASFSWFPSRLWLCAGHGRRCIDRRPRPGASPRWSGWTHSHWGSIPGCGDDGRREELRSQGAE